jgi:hypothetical protein
MTNMERIFVAVLSANALRAMGTGEQSTPNA